MAAELRALYARSAKCLLWNVFLRDSMRGLKLWLATGYGCVDMPVPMLFFGLESGVLEKSIVVERMKYAHSNLMFLPELIEMGHDVDRCYSEICNDEIVRALRIIRCRHVLKDCQIKNPTKLDSHVLSRLISTQAAILSDDKAWLGALAAEPGFEFSSEQLAFAARYGSIACFRFISINGAEYKQTVLEAAVYGGNEEIIQMCLEHGCDVRTEEVLKQSIRGCQTKVVEWLVDVHEMKPTADVVVNALMSGHYDVVVRFGSVLNDCDTLKFGQWSDSILPRNDDFRHFIECVLDDPSIRSNLRDHIMQHRDAILYCDDVDLANKCGVDINRFESTLFASQHGCRCILMTISQNGNIDVLDRERKTALILCARDFFFDGLLLLVEHGANVNAADECGRTALMEASYFGHTDTVKYLIECGANVNVFNRDGWTPLIYATWGGRPFIVKYLVEQGADIDAVEERGWTALVFAARNHHTDIVEYLVEHGANLDAVCNQGWTVLMHAAFRSHTDIVKYLVEHGATQHE